MEYDISEHLQTECWAFQLIEYININYSVSNPTQPKIVPVWTCWRATTILPGTTEQTLRDSPANSCDPHRWRTTSLGKKRTPFTIPSTCRLEWYEATVSCLRSRHNITTSYCRHHGWRLYLRSFSADSHVVVDSLLCRPIDFRRASLTASTVMPPQKSSRTDVV